MTALVTTTDAFMNYGLGGLIFATMVVPMAYYILKDKDRQIAYRDEELMRARAENADLRRVIEPIAPALAEVSRSVTTAITIIERSRQ